MCLVYQKHNKAWIVINNDIYKRLQDGWKLESLKKKKRKVLSSRLGGWDFLVEKKEKQKFEKMGFQVLNRHLTNSKNVCHNPGFFFSLT